MKKILLKISALILSLSIVLSILNISSFALKSGNYTYTLSGTNAKITGVDSSVSGTLEIPSKISNYTVTAIGAYALSGCDKITKIVLPSSVTTLDSHAFSDCDGLKTVSISSGLKTVGTAVFFDCDSLTEITVASSNSAFLSENGVLFNKNKTELICFPSDKSGTSYSVPSTVKAISDYAFADADVTYVKLPSSVEKLGIGAFSDSDITKIDFSSKITTIPERAFYNCSDLKEISLPSAITLIDAYAFFGCELLTAVTLPTSLNVIRASAFNDCSRLKSIAISSSNKSYCSIDGILYSKATTSLMIYPNGRTDKSFDVPSHVRTVAQNAFGYSENLESINVPVSVTKVNPFAFIGCENLKTIKFANKSTTISNGILDGCKNVNVYCIKDSTAHKYAVANSIKYTHFTPSTITSVKLNVSTLTWASGRSGSFKPTVSPANAKLLWKSSNTSVATVSDKGVLKTIKPGTTTITCTAADDSTKFATCKVTVVQGVTEVKLNAHTINWIPGKAGHFKPTVSPTSAANKNLTWKSSNPSVATVSSTGKLTAISFGTTIITCTAKDGTGKSDTCVVNVVKPVKEVKLNATKITWAVGKSGHFKPTVSPTDAYNKSLTWTSSNPSVATVSSAGKLTAVSKGTATITCKAKDGSGKYATCKVTVK